MTCDINHNARIISSKVCYKCMSSIPEVFDEREKDKRKSKRRFF